MTNWIVAAVGGVALALLSYTRGRSARVSPMFLAILRAVTLTLLLALVLDAPAGARRPVAALVALDVSASWLRARDSSAWADARRRARAVRADSVLLVGDSARIGSPPARPTDGASRLRAAVERALAVGRPLRVFTDGEIDDPEALDGLPNGSDVTVLAGRASRDAALTDLQAPRAMIAGDTTEMRINVSAGGAGASGGALAVTLGDLKVATAAFDALPAYGERALTVRAKVPAVAGETILRVVLSSAGDAEARNDTLSVVVNVSAAAGAVLASTSPDYDARDALSVLRGALALPTRGYYRIAPGAWRVEGSLTAVTEDEVRRAIHDAPLAILHGDTALFGAPRTATRGALALVAPPSDAGEWFATGAPASPLAAALSGIAWDSLPPLEVSGTPPAGEWEGLETRRARRFERRVAIVGSERPRRTVVVAASGFWRWRFRGGASADAYATLWGSIFDWLSGERSDQRAAAPAEGVLRAGEPVRWRRGAGPDSVVTVVLRRRGGDARVDSVTLRFASSETVAQSAPRDAGIYDVQVAGGAAVLTVNPSRELLPRRPTVRTGAVGRGASLADAPRLRSLGAAYVVLLLSLCAEWLLRRRKGLR
jgi:hypothetical protein